MPKDIVKIPDSEKDLDPNKVKFKESKSLIEAVEKMLGENVDKTGGKDADGKDLATVGDITKAIDNAIITRMKNEIVNDPTARGYAGKTDDEIAQLCNDSYIDATGYRQASRAAIVLSQIPFAPNQLTGGQITEIRK